MEKKTYILFSFLFISFLAMGQTSVERDSLPAKPLNKIDRIVSNNDTTIIVNEKVLYKEPQIDKVTLKGQVYSAMIIDGDTIIMADLEDVSITSMRKFEDDAEYRKYLKFRAYANRVYPYAKEAIRIFRELEYAEQTMKKKAFKKESKRLQNELKEEFEQPLKKLTKLQGKIMIKMIENELDESFYDLVKGLKGRFTAFYWHNFSKLYGYDLKEGYNYGKYKILDAVLHDFDISYSIERDDELKYIKKNDEI